LVLFSTEHNLKICGMFLVGIEFWSLLRQINSVTCVCVSLSVFCGSRFIHFEIWNYQRSLQCEGPGMCVCTNTSKCQNFILDHLSASLSFRGHWVSVHPIIEIWESGDETKVYRKQDAEKTIAKSAGAINSKSLKNSSSKCFMFNCDLK
jgi:hypothetical protein